ncbi:histidine kinase [Massilia aurea]|uniref:sensor histidine kinase n=1 Tax=Massilia aurea TaxID=373040 RepID=UPI003462A9E6
MTTTKSSLLSPMWRLYIAAWLGYMLVVALVNQADTLVAGQFNPHLLWRSFISLAPSAGMLALLWPLSGWFDRRAVTGARRFAIHVVAALAFATYAHTVLIVTQKPPSHPLSWHIWPFLYNVMSYAVVAGVFHVVRANAAAQRQALAAQQAQTLLVAAELGALRSKLNPHFLFNTLHSIIALTQRNPQAAETALFQFSNMLRYVLDTERAGIDRVTLDAEFDFVRDYLELESLRLGARLQVEWDLDPTLGDCLVPALTLQPLVENSIKHAFNPFTRTGLLRIESRREPDTGLLRVTVRDDGPGAAPATIAASPGLGIRTIGRRLDLDYAGRAALRIDSRPGAGFAACVTLPTTP